MNLISSPIWRLRLRSESSSSLNSASSGPGSSVLSSPSSPTSTAATSALEDDDFDIIQDLYIRKDAGMESSTRQAYESVLLPLINQELVHSTYAERYSITLCSIGFQKSAFFPAILISTPAPRAKKRIFAHLSGLTDLKVTLKEHGLALHVVVHRIRRCGGTSAQLGNVGKLAYVVPRPGSSALCGSKIVIPKSGRMGFSSCTSGLTFTVGGRECGKTALHPWEGGADATPDADSESSLSDEEDDETDDGLALSLLPDGTGLLDESGNSSSLFSDCSIDGLKLLPQTPQLASNVTNGPPNANESVQSARRGPSRFNPIYRGLQTDWLLYDAQEAAPDTALSELARNEVDGYKITKFHHEDPDAKVPVTIADHEAVVYGYIQPGAVSFRSGSRVYDLRLVTLEYPLRPGCSGAAVTHQDQLCGTIQVISEDVPWAYMVPVEAELKEMEDVCGLPVQLSGAEEADVVELDSQQSFASTPTERSATDSSSDRNSSDIFVVPLDHQINPATEAALLMHGSGMHTTGYGKAPANTAEAAQLKPAATVPTAIHAMTLDQSRAVAQDRRLKRIRKSERLDNIPLAKAAHWREILEEELKVQGSVLTALPHPSPSSIRDSEANGFPSICDSPEHAPDEQDESEILATAPIFRIPSGRLRNDALRQQRSVQITPEPHTLLRTSATGLAASAPGGHIHRTQATNYRSPSNWDTSEVPPPASVSNGSMPQLPLSPPNSDPPTPGLQRAPLKRSPGMGNRQSHPESLPAAPLPFPGRRTTLIEPQSLTAGINLFEASTYQNQGRWPEAEALTCIELTYPMAEPIGLASGVLALTTFAFQSSITLYNMVQSFQSHPRRVRDLIEELEALNGVLGSLAETVSTTTNIELSALDLPLLRCGKSCKEFEQELMKCSSRSGGSRTSFRDWAKLRHIGEDIDGFRRLLAGYKLTVNITLIDANLRKFSVTTESVESAESYKELIKTATSDLESHLESINEKLEMIFEQTIIESDSDATERRLTKEELLSTQGYLQICAQLSDHISQIQLTPKRSSSSPGQINPDAFPEKVTNTSLQESKNSLIFTTAKLEWHRQDLMDRLMTKSKTAMTSKEDITELTRLRDEWETARLCVDICSKADKHLQESIGNINATGDAVQFMVSTDGKTVHGKNREPGLRTRQVGGLLSDVSLQQLSWDITSVSIQNTGNKGPPSRGETQSVLNCGVENGPSSDFHERYGRGFSFRI